ncbi:MAG: dihydroneopterin aldolase [Pseudomonadota bacterium]
MMWPPGVNAQTLSLKDVRVQIRLGAFDYERQDPQTVEVHVELSRRYDGYQGEDLSGCMNYDPVYRYVTEDWPMREHVDLIEAWAEDLVRFCLRDPIVEACRVRLRKVDIFPDTASPEIELVRYRDPVKP